MDNKYSINAFLDFFKKEKQINPKADFVVCAGVSGWSFRASLIEIEKSSLRKGKAKCALVEEIQIDPYSEKIDLI